MAIHHPMRAAVRHVAAASGRPSGRALCGGVWRTAPPLSLARRLCAPRGSRLPARLLCSQAGEKPEEKSASGEAASEASAAAAHAEEQTEAPPGPVVLFRCPSLSQNFASAERLVNHSALGSALGLGTALLGIAPFLSPNTFMIAMMLAAVQVRLAHTLEMRMLRSQVRRNVEEIVQLDQDRISIHNGGGVVRTLQLSPDAASEGRPPVSEVMRVSDPWIFIDRKLGTVEAQEALDALLQSDRAIASEDLSIKPFEGEPQTEADQVVQSLAKISAKELEALAKSSPNSQSPKAAIAQVSRSATTVAGIILIAGGVICIVGRRQADAPMDGSVVIQ